MALPLCAAATVRKLPSTGQMLQEGWPNAFASIRKVTFIAHALILIVFLLMFTPNKSSGYRRLLAGRSDTEGLGNLCFPALAFPLAVQRAFPLLCLRRPSSLCPRANEHQLPETSPREDAMAKSKEISSRSTSPSAAKMSSWSLADRSERLQANIIEYNIT